MATVRRAYGSWSQRMLQSLRDDGGLKVEAFISWLDAEHDIQVDRSLVSHWCAGRTHLPADLLPLLAEFCGDADPVFGPFLRSLDYEVVHIPGVPPSERDLVDLTLSAGASLGRLQDSLRQARSADSPGGMRITPEERLALRQRLNELIHLLADVRARLPAENHP